MHKAKWNGTLVAVKSLKQSSEIALADFRSEIDTLRKVHHPNAVQFLGARSKAEPYLLITGATASPAHCRHSAACTIAVAAVATHLICLLTRRQHVRA